MAEKVSTLVVTLNHGCSRCFTKIRRTVCKLQETEDIRVVSCDEVSGTVMISGAFDPLVLPCKLRRKAGCLIRDIQLVAVTTPHRPPVQRRPAMLPNPSSCCGTGICGCGCGGYYGYDYGCCSCQDGYHGYGGGLPLGQYPKLGEVTCDCEEASSPACKIM